MLWVHKEKPKPAAKRFYEEGAMPIEDRETLKTQEIHFLGGKGYVIRIVELNIRQLIGRDCSWDPTGWSPCFWRWSVTLLMTRVLRRRFLMLQGDEQKSRQTRKIWWRDPESVCSEILGLHAKAGIYCLFWLNVELHLLFPLRDFQVPG